MDLAFAAESLKPIPKSHILARKAADLEGIRHLAAHHLDLIKIVLSSFEGKATVDQIQQSLVPDVIRDDWKKWWETAKREMKKDGHFIVPIKKTEPVVYQAEETSLQARSLADFRAAKGLKARVVVVAEILKVVSDLGDKVAVANEIVAALNTDITSYQRTQPSVALEAIFARDELQHAAGHSRRRRRSYRGSNLAAGRHQIRSAWWKPSPPRNITARWNLSARRIPTAGTKSCAARSTWCPPSSPRNLPRC